MYIMPDESQPALCSPPQYTLQLSSVHSDSRPILKHLQALLAMRPRGRHCLFERHLTRERRTVPLLHRQLQYPRRITECSPRGLDPDIRRPFTMVKDL